MTTTIEPPARTSAPADPLAEIDALIARNPGWFDELSAEKRRLLGEGARKILGA